MDNSVLSARSPTVSIIVPVHNGGEHFRKCFLSLNRIQPTPHEIIIVADGESDGSWRLAETSAARLIRLPVPGGPARARNQGANAATGDVLLFIDSDVTVPVDIVGRVGAIFRHDAALTALIGSYDDAPGSANFLSQYKNLLHHYVHQSARADGFTFWGACGAVRREVFLALHGFDESYRVPSIEDIELGYRLTHGGYKVRLVKDLQVKHLKRWGVFSLLKSDFFHRALPWTSLCLRYGRLPDDLNLKFSSRLSALLTCTMAAILAGAWWKPNLLNLAGVLALALVVLNAPLYLFFYRLRGLSFALRAIPWHWFYFLYSTVAFAAGGIIHFANFGIACTAKLRKTFPPMGKS